MSTIYLSVAIPYVNADPHIGYAYELVQADIHARAQRALGHDVRFQGGTDDYSLKNVLAAEHVDQAVEEFVGQKGDRFEELSKPLNLSFDDFVRTSSDARHAPAVKALWSAAFDAGDLYQKEYEGDYCVGCEQFYSPSELTAEGTCPEHFTTPEPVSETNHFFRLSAYQQYLDELISTDRLQIRPEPFRQEVLSFIRSGLSDISVSRSISRARGWGLPVENDPSQIIYVWFDALTNYVSSLGFGDNDRAEESADYERWWCNSDERTHVIGKGILRFHAVYWPAFLQSAGQPSPTRIQVHPYLSVDGKKISKSAGTSIDPIDVVDEYGEDALRWFFAREVNEVSDTDFTIDRLVARANDELANSIGNAVNRTLTLVHKYLDSTVPLEPPLISATNLVQQTRDDLCEFELRKAASAIADVADELNRDIATSAPWALAKQPGSEQQLARVLGRHVATGRILAVAIEPITPRFAAALTHQLGVGTERLPANTPTFRRLS